MKNKKLIFCVLFTGILVLNTFLFTNINENKLHLNSLFTLVTAQSEGGEIIARVQFCTKDWDTKWGICQYTGNPNIGLDCIRIVENCSVCDCDGTYWKEIYN